MKLLNRLHKRLPGDMRRALGIAVAAAERRSVGLYLVGGAVRDLLMNAGHVDIDLVVEGDAIALADAVGKKLRARVVKHPRFGTASLLTEGARLDFAGARTESYLRPGALPAVQPSDLLEDLARRDFTINAMALRLAGGRLGELIDPHNGQRDVDKRTLRVLHDDSFQDDATRILRAVRYAGRLRFRLQRRTDALLRRDLSFLDAVSGTRVRHELERIAVEERVSEILRRAENRGVIEATHAAFSAGETQRRAAARLEELPPAHRDAALFCILLSDASPAAVEQAMGRLEVTGRQAAILGAFVALRAQEPKLMATGLRPSEAARLLSPRPVEAIEAFALVAERRAAEAARRYLGSYRLVRPRLNGDDVQALGVPEGPQVGSALASLRAARLDGKTHSREDEAALIEELLDGRTEAAARRG